ncbi:MAG: hypothetical protein DI619_03070 [Francisella sp.]|nr:MAG: hypothetical protein DI619_03070 [Francisella sp.]
MASLMTAYKYRIYSSDKQKILTAKTFGCVVRFIIQC